MSHRTNIQAGRRAAGGTRGTVLIVAMWVLLVLAGTALVLARSMRAEGDRAANDVAVAQVAAIEQGAIQYVLANVNGLSGQTPADPDVPCEAVEVGDGAFWILRPSSDSDVTYAYGITDESSRLNLNTATLDMVSKLPNMTSEFAASIIDWRSPASVGSAGGAESAYYLLLPDPYECKNAPLETVEELFLIKGATTDIVYGQDANRNGILDPGEQATLMSGAATLSGSRLDRGIVNLVTVYTVQPAGSGSTSSGVARVNVNTASLMTIGTTLQPAISGSRMPGVLDRIRRERPFRNIFDFYYKVELTADEFQKTYPLVTASTGAAVQGLINVNTAPPEVLLCLPTMEDSDVAAIVARRPTDTTVDRSNIAWVAQALSRAKVQAIGSYITGVTYQFSADIVSVSSNGRAFRRCRIVVDARKSPPKVLYRQDLTRLGWPLDPEILSQLRAGAGLDRAVQVTSQGTASP